jgi:hypothetical protein
VNQPRCWGGHVAKLTDHRNPAGGTLAPHRERGMLVLGVKFLQDWNGTDGHHYHSGDQVSLAVSVAYDLRTRGIVDPTDSADPLWAQWDDSGK